MSLLRMARGIRLLGAALAVLWLPAAALDLDAVEFVGEALPDNSLDRLRRSIPAVPGHGRSCPFATLGRLGILIFLMDHLVQFNYSHFVSCAMTRTVTSSGAPLPSTAASSPRSS